MKLWLRVLLCILLLAVVAGAFPVFGQSVRNDLRTTVIVPASSQEHGADIGLRAHTNHLIFAPEQGTGSPTGLVPSKIRTAYYLPTYTGAASGAGTNVIAIVDAFDYPTAVADFNAFSTQFGLPTETGTGSVLQVVYATGIEPSYNSGWSQEAALDIEWAHAMAPTAKIVLVEAASNSFSDLLHAVSVAGGLSGVREVSMSWGGSEYSTEIFYDGSFTAGGVVYFAASGDSGGRTIWPGVSPNVVCAGGTTLTMSSTGAFVSETGWSGSGGGKSKYESRPAYQNVIQSIVGTRRGVPDLAFDANPNTGVSVYWQGGWYVFGGTSVSTPSLAGIVNLAADVNGGAYAGSTVDEQSNRIYANVFDSSPAPFAGSPYDFRDIVSGSAGRFRCTQYWDFVTGVGSNWGLNGK